MLELLGLVFGGVGAQTLTISASPKAGADAVGVK
jgi:hypothetical protein